MKIIALEEHVVPAFIADAWNALTYRRDNSVSLNERGYSERLADLGQHRLQDMDDSGVDIQVLSLPAPGLNNFNGDDAIPFARSFNDLIAETVRREPTRFEGFATLPCSDPKASAHELDRAIGRLGLKGALLSGRVRDRNLDHPVFEPIFEAAANLQVPLYIHPQLPSKPIVERYYSGFNEIANLMFATGAVGWHYETGIQLLRLIMSGVFDKYPTLQLITGHWGEVVLFYLDRIKILNNAGLALKRPIESYFCENIYYTPSGIFNETYLLRAVEIVGAGRIMFSQDYPYHTGSKGEARRFLESANLLPNEKELIAHGNWEHLFSSHVKDTPADQDGAVRPDLVPQIE